MSTPPRRPHTRSINKQQQQRLRPLTRSMSKTPNQIPILPSSTSFETVRRGPLTRKSPNKNQILPSETAAVKRRRLNLQNPDINPPRILKVLHKLKNAYKPTIVRSLAQSNDYIEVLDRSRQYVLNEINDMLRSIDGNNREAFQFLVPTRHESFQTYVEGRFALWSNYRIRRSFSNNATAGIANKMSTVLREIQVMCSNNTYLTKRNLYYSLKELFKNQEESDSIVEDICIILKYTRESLRIHGSPKGLVGGMLRYKLGRDLYNCALPQFIDENWSHSAKLYSDALFILVVEKHATFELLCRSTFWKDYPCIIVTGFGQPDMATRLFLKRLNLEFKLPVLTLVDCDTYDVQILSSYKNGSKAMSYDSYRLTMPNVKWLGLRPSDLNVYRVENEGMIDEEVKCAKKMLAEDFVKSNRGWKSELSCMVRSKKKTDIQGICRSEFDFLESKYLPIKLRDHDWV